jgi:diguanylate cyclase (GGDEF)-like protein
MESSRKEDFDQEALRSVREGKHFLEWALRCGGVGVFLEYRNGEVHTTEMTRQWFSIPSDSPVATAEQFLCRIHPEDREDVAQLRQEMLDNAEHFQLKCRVIDSEGQTQWVQIEGDRGEPGSDLVVACTVRDITEQVALERRLEESNAQLEELVQTDLLTGLYTRRHFESALQEHCAEAARYKVPLSCLMLDLDHFKDVNDTFGHDMGDIVLREVAGILLHNAREADMVARFGGEVFVILLPHTPRGGAKVIADRLCQAVANHAFDSIPDKRRLTISIGACSTREEGPVAPKELVKQSDQAMYQSKRNGRNQVTCVQM